MLKLKGSKYIFIFLLPCISLFLLLSAEELAPFQEQAQVYRNRGLQFQNQGRLNEAMAAYQQAITVDPSFVVAYNDLGIVYEAKGWMDKAEEAYLSGLDVDPNYPNLYSNLAMLYEQKQDYRRAAIFWKRRVELGSPYEAWTEKAKTRLATLRRAVPELRQAYLQEEAEDLAREIAMARQAKRVKELAE